MLRLDDMQSRMLALYSLPPPADGGPGDNAQMRESIASFCAAQVLPLGHGDWKKDDCACLLQGLCTRCQLFKAADGRLGNEMRRAQMRESIASFCAAQVQFTSARRPVQCSTCSNSADQGLDSVWALSLQSSDGAYIACAAVRQALAAVLHGSDPAAHRTWAKLARACARTSASRHPP